ncbi:hypothetical protein Tco_1203626 [Tanacetum coccineum]
MHSQGNLHNRVEKLRHELDEVQKALDKNPTSSVLREEEAAYLTAYTKALLDEERFLKQKAKIKWPRLGDSNLVYFHRSINARVSRSRIDCVYGHDNIMYEGNIVPNVFVNHYTSFLGVEGDTINLNYEGLFSKRLNSNRAEKMICDVTNSEIHTTIFSIGNDKSSRPDGFTLVFFLKSWDVVGGDMCRATKDFFTNSQMFVGPLESDIRFIKLN